MTNTQSKQNFLYHARKLRKRQTYGGCTELSAHQHGTNDSVYLYMGVRGDIGCSVAFTRGR